MPHGPTPDFDKVTLKWTGVNLDGTWPTGTLELSYNGGPLLDDDAAVPVSVYPVTLRKTLETTTITVDGVSATVAAATFDVPASDDPDILGSGGSYHLKENLNNGQGREIDFYASRLADGGVIYLNRLTASSPIPGQAIPTVSVADFRLLQAQVTQLAGQVGNGGGGGGGTGADAETIRDTIASALRPGGLVTITPNDAADIITFGSTYTAEQLRDRQTHTGTQLSSSISDFTEAVQDAVALLLQGASGVTLAYDDAGNKLTITGGGSGSLDAEAVRDAIGVALVGTAPVSIVVNDAADTITISLQGGLLGKQLLAAADVQSVLALQNLDGVMVTQPYSVNGPRRTVPPGAQLLIIGGPQATNPAWMLPADLRWADVS